MSLVVSLGDLSTTAFCELSALRSGPWFMTYKSGPQPLFFNETHLECLPKLQISELFLARLNRTLWEWDPDIWTLNHHLNCF